MQSGLGHCQQPFEYLSRSTQSSAVGQFPKWAFPAKWITSEYAARRNWSGVRKMPTLMAGILVGSDFAELFEHRSGELF
jgi:hypothetical protein